MKRGLTLAGAIAALWLMTAVTLAQMPIQVEARLAPAITGIEAEHGLRRAAVDAADANISKAAARRILQTAQAVLLRAPANAVAARVIGTANARLGDLPRSLSAFVYGERLSRRDVPTQLVLVETAVARGDISAALVHYDRAMRTSLYAREILIPVLAGAARDPSIAVGLAPFLHRRPAWADDFLLAASREAISVPAFLSLLREARLSPENGVQRGLLEGGTIRLISLGATARAWSIYGEALKLTDGWPGLRNGNFESLLGPAPFDWSLLNGEGLSPSIEPQEGAKGMALLLSASAKGELARQAVLLSPGSYTIHARIGAVGSDSVFQPSVALRCVNGTSLMDRTFGEAPAEGRDVAWQVTVPSGCPSQWLSFSSGGATEPGIVPWVDDIRIERTRASGSAVAVTSE